MQRKQFLRLMAASLGGVLLASNTEPRLPAGWSRQASVEADRACVAGMDNHLTERGRRLLEQVQRDPALAATPAAFREAVQRLAAKEAA